MMLLRQSALGLRADTSGSASNVRCRMGVAVIEYICVFCAQPGASPCLTVIIVSAFFSISGTAPEIFGGQTWTVIWTEIETDVHEGEYMRYSDFCLFFYNEMKKGALGNIRGKSAIARFFLEYALDPVHVGVLPDSSAMSKWFTRKSDADESMWKVIKEDFDEKRLSSAVYATLDKSKLEDTMKKCKFIPASGNTDDQQQEFSRAIARQIKAFAIGKGTANNVMAVKQVEIIETPPVKGSVYYKPYFDAVTENIKHLNTILRAEAYIFQDTYVPVGLCKGDRSPMDDSELPLEIIPDPTISNLLDYSRCVLIQASGGMGKSMLLRYLMFDGIAECMSSEKIPVFIQLKNYVLKDYKILDFFYDEIHKYMPDLEKARFTYDFEAGNYILLLDGLDEINSLYRSSFLNQLVDLLARNRSTQVVMSARPFSLDIPVSMFKVLAISPLSLNKAVQILNKVEYYPTIPQLKESFIDALKQHLYVDYRLFAQNPLLLSFMLIKYCEDGRMPVKKSEFYEEVFDVLATRHDLKKEGYRRNLESGLSHERLKDFFAAFCARTYQNNQFSFSYSSLKNSISNLLLKSSYENERRIDPGKLIEDYVSAVCMLYKEGETYYFVHRSFQEYFCARSLVKQRDTKLKDLVEYFDNGANRYSDMVLPFLYELRPEKVEEHIFLPFLEELISKCENGLGYWTYVMLMYSDFRYEYISKLKPENHIYETYSMPESYLLYFILDKYCKRKRARRPELNQYDEYIETEYTYININGKSVWTTMDQARFFYEDRGRLEEFYEHPPEKVGYVVNIPTKELYDLREDMPLLISEFEDDQFRLKVEYEELKRIKKAIKQRVSFNTDDFVEII